VRRLVRAPRALRAPALALLVLAATFTIAPRAAAGFRLSEIVPKARDGVGEWIEIVNTADSERDVSGWSLADATGKARRVAVSRRVPAGGWLVLAAQPESVRAHFGLPDSVDVIRPDGWPILNDHDAEGGLPADAIVLIRPDGGIADSAAYFESWLPPEPGRSLERADVGLPATLSGAWGWSDAPAGGTPGRANTVGAPVGGEAGEPWTGPDEAAPARQPAVFVYRVPARGMFGVWLVDTEGSTVAVLQEPSAVYGAGRWVWGGGMPLPPRSGPYLVCMRWQGEGDTIRRCRAVWVTR
jgi:hypothetical protein